MPIPKPIDEEHKHQFIDRCMNNDIMKSEYPDIGQRYAICNSSWERRLK